MSDETIKDPIQGPISESEGGLGHMAAHGRHLIAADTPYHL